MTVRTVLFLNSLRFVVWASKSRKLISAANLRKLISLSLRTKLEVRTFFVEEHFTALTQQLEK